MGGSRNCDCIEALLSVEDLGVCSFSGEGESLRSRYGFGSGPAEGSSSLLDVNEVGEIPSSRDDRVLLCRCWESGVIGSCLLRVGSWEKG